MAEYKMSYDELQKFVEDAISNSKGDKDKLLSHKSEILTALTGVFSDETMANKKEQDQLMELWTNQEREKSKLLLGKRYIRIHDGMLTFLEAFLTGGAFDIILESNKQNVSLSEAITVGALSTVVLSLVHLFREAAKLEDFDFCLYKQAVANHYEKSEFTEEDIISWYPIDGTCNIHTKKWNCCHLSHVNKCGINIDNIRETISLLEKKGILDFRYENEKKIYKIKG